MNAPMIGSPMGPLGIELPSLSTRRHENKILAMVYAVAEIIQANKTGI